MTDRDSPRSPRVMRRIAALLIRSPEARFILDDLDELLDRDVACGMSSWRARWRYGKNMLASAFSTSWAHRRIPIPRAVSWIDFKLGFRMLVKYPGLTIIGGLAMAFAISVGAGGFELATQYIRPNLPLDDGDRIVGIRLWHTASGWAQDRAAHDFVRWREALESVEDVGAFHTIERNLITGDAGEPVEVAEISASAFRVTRVPPLRGRFLVDADEPAGAAPVAVIGYDVWQTRFGGDPNVVGRTVRLGNTRTTVVGIMPDGFAFPISHSVWVPLRLDVSNYERAGGPVIRVFGRLAPGATLETAQAELTTLGLRMAADFPDTHEHVRPRVLPYAQSITNASPEIRIALTLVNVFFLTLLVLVCGNVALLMFARATTRESEIVVRSALGASRGRIIAQLLAEALVLAGVAAVVGLAVAGFALKDWLNVVEKESGGSIPFWFSASIAPTTALYAGLLTVLGAVIAGVVPALKVTRRLGARLRQSAAGAGGLRFGGLWTGVIVAQVAVTVVFPAIAFEVRRMVVEVRTADVGFPIEEYVSARLELDRESAGGVAADTSYAAFLGRFGAAIQELERRVQAEPGVAGVTFADPVPLTPHRWFWIEVDDAGAASPDTAIRPRVVIASIDPGYFDVLDIPILSGRGFHSGDLGSERGTVIVNQSFVERVLAGRNPIGRESATLGQRMRNPDRGMRSSASSETWACSAKPRMTPVFTSRPRRATSIRYALPCT